MSPSDLAIGAAAFCFSLAGVAYVRHLALRHHILDIPNRRSSHEAPVPRGGGAAIAGTVIVGMLVLVFTGHAYPARTLAAWTAGSLLIASVSALDDLKSLPTLVRLVAHTAAAVLVITVAGPFTAIGQAPAVLAFPSAGYVLTLLWIVGLTNAFNFMDGIDGIAAGQAAVAGAALVLLGSMQNERLIEIGGILIAAASAGFLMFNWSPASIFMGDVGSAFLGYSLAVLPLMSRAASRPQILLVSAIAMWPFLFDAIFTFTRRLLKGENVMRAHRSHLYQRLVMTGVSHAAVSLLYISMAAVAAALALVGVRDARFTVAAFASATVMAAALWLLVRFREVRTVSKQRIRASPRPSCDES